MPESSWPSMDPDDEEPPAPPPAEEDEESDTTPSCADDSSGSLSPAGSTANVSSPVQESGALDILDEWSFGPAEIAAPKEMSTTPRHAAKTHNKRGPC